MKTLCYLLVMFSALNGIGQFRYQNKQKFFSRKLNDIALSPDGNIIAAAANTPSVRIFDSKTLESLSVLDCEASEIYELTFSEDGLLLAVANSKNEILLWNTQTWTLVKRIVTGQEFITDLCFSPNDSLLVSSSTTSLVLFQKNSDWENPKVLYQGAESWSLAFSHKGKYFAAGIGTTIRLWKNNNWRKSETLSAHNKPVVSIAFSPNDRSIATASLDSTICVWSIDGSVDFTQFKAHNERVQKICFSPNGEYLLSGGSDSKVKLWSGAGWKTVVPYNSDAPVCDLVFDKLGDKFYMATADGYVHYYSKSDENLAHNFVNLPITEGFVNNGTSAKRVAILIANAAYDADSKLQNPLRDADSLEVALKALNFEVFKYQNLEYQGMLKAISDFGDYIGEKKRQGWNVASLIYFSGHGMQVRGHSYLVPINDHIGGEEDVEYEAYDLDRMFKKLEVEKGDINIVVIDACRNNPFDERLGLAVRKITLPSLQTGMGQPTQQSQNTIVAYSTMPNMLALDGFEDNSPFVKELLKYMRVPSLQIEDMFKEVRKAVRFKTQAQQIPWISSTLLGNFSFVE